MVNGGRIRCSGAFSLIKRIADLAVELGWPNALLYGLNRMVARAIGRNIIFRYLLVAQPVKSVPVLPARRGRSIKVQLLAEDDAALSGLP